MKRMLWLLVSTGVGALLACQTSLGGNTFARPYERIGVGTFSIEMPPGEGWHLEQSDSSLTFERRETSWFQTIGTTLMSVSSHPLPGLAKTVSEEAFAKRFLEEEEASRAEPTQNGDIGNVFNEELTPDGKRLHRLTSEGRSCIRSDESAWADEPWASKTEIIVYFPEGLRGRLFYSFECRESHRVGFPKDPGGPRLVDWVNESFQMERTPAPAVRTGVDAISP